MGESWYVLEVRISAEEMPDVEMRIAHFVLQEGQQFGILRRIVGAEIVGLLHDAAAHHPIPDAIGDGAREPRIGGRGEPVGEGFARILAGGEMRGRAIGESGDGGGALLIRIEVDDLLFPLAGLFVADAREEGRHIRELGGGPLFGARSHEGERHRLGDAFGPAILHGAVEVGGRLAEIAAAGGEEVVGEAVVGAIFENRGVDPMVVGLGGIGPEVDGELGFDAQEVAPLGGPVVGELVAREQAIDEGGSLVGIGARQEVGGLFGGGQGADDVEIGAAEEDGVGREAGGLDAQLLPVREDQLVDLALRGEFVAALKGGMQSGGHGGRGEEGGQDS